MKKIFAKTYLLSRGKRLKRYGEPVAMYVYGTRKQIDESIEYEFVKEVTLEKTGTYIKILKGNKNGNSREESEAGSV